MSSGLRLPLNGFYRSAVSIAAGVAFYRNAPKKGLTMERATRRSFLKAAAGMAAMPPLAATPETRVMGPPGSEKARKDNRVIEENRKAGTVEWQLQYTRFDDPITMASYPLNSKLRC